MDPKTKLKNHEEDFPYREYEYNRHVTFSCWTCRDSKGAIYLRRCSSAESLRLGSNLVMYFLECLGRSHACLDTTNMFLALHQGACRGGGGLHPTGTFPMGIILAMLLIWIGCCWITGLLTWALSGCSLDVSPNLVLVNEGSYDCIGESSSWSLYPPCSLIFWV